MFILLYRVLFDAPKSWRRERRAVYRSNVAIAAVLALLGLVFGYNSVVAVQLPTMVVASIVGVWLFSVQHRFDGAEWVLPRLIGALPKPL